MGPKPSDMQVLFDVHQLGVYVSFSDQSKIKETLLRWFVKNDMPQPGKDIKRYERNAIAQDYLALIRSLS